MENKILKNENGAFNAKGNAVINYYDFRGCKDLNVVIPDTAVIINEPVENVRKGWHHTEETKRKMSEGHRGRIVSEETRRKLSEANKGKTLSEETRKKVGDAQRGKVVSEETRLKMSEAHKGKVLSEETRRRMSESRKGRKLTEEHKKHIGDGHRGMKYNEQIKDVIQPVEIVPEKNVEPVATVSIPEMKTRKSMFETVKDFLYSKVLAGFKKLTSFFKVKRKHSETGNVNDNVETVNSQIVESHVESPRRDDLIPVNIESAEDFRIANDLPKVKMSYIDMKPRAIRSNRRKSNRCNYKRAETSTSVMHNDDSTQAA